MMKLVIDESLVFITLDGKPIVDILFSYDATNVQHNATYTVVEQMVAAFNAETVNAKQSNLLQFP